MTVIQPKRRYVDQRARAELLGSVGAGVLGAGLALLLREALATLAVPFLVVGGAVHAMAMYQKHRLDTSEGTAGPRWTEWAYWACWLLLLVLAGYVWWLRGRT
jgi:uncharacterized membrane protein